jgi:hypothetical protein
MVLEVGEAEVERQEALVSLGTATSPPDTLQLLSDDAFF